MALKRVYDRPSNLEMPLAVPSYGAMALKLATQEASRRLRHLAVPSYGAMALKLLMTLITAIASQNLQSPPTGRWP